MQPLLALAPPAGPPGTAPNPTAQSATFLLIMVVLVVIFYLVLIRPQQKKARTLSSTKTDSSSSSVEGRPSAFNEILRTRYSEAYTEAHVVVSIGKTIKNLAIFLFAVIFLVGIVMLFRNDAGGIGAVVMAGAFVIGIPIYILGVLVSAQGQTQLATLDTAINSSRHLTNDEVAQVLSKRFSF